MKYKAGLIKATQALYAPVFAIALSFLIGAVVIVALGRNPWEVYGYLLGGGISGWPNFAVTLQMMTPLLFTGLAVAIAFRAGLWNIGVEGQMLVGALLAGIVGYVFDDLPMIIHLPLSLLAGIIGGALWAAIPALLRVYLGVNELVVCLMLNPVALLFTGYVANKALKAPGPTNKLPDIAASATLPSLTLYSQLNAGIFLALAICLLFALFNRMTVLGFKWNLIGLNPRFAYYGGIDVRRHALYVMLLSGAIAGLAGAEQVLGQLRAFYDSFSPGYGFDGIAVAMLAANSPLGVIAAAFLFGTLAGGSAVLQMMTGLSKYFVQLLQFIVVLVLAAQFGFHWLKKQPVTSPEKTDIEKTDDE